MNEKIEKVVNADKLLAIIIRSHFSREGIEFFTPDDFSLQFAYMNRPAGCNITPNINNIHYAVDT